MSEEMAVYGGKLTEGRMSLDAVKLAAQAAAWAEQMMQAAGDGDGTRYVRACSQLESVARKARRRGTGVTGSVRERAGGGAGGGTASV